MSDSTLNNRYKIIKKLGEGGFGQTFLAEDLHLPTKPVCVVKRLKPQFPDEETFKLAQRLFEQEAEVLYRLGNHPHIPVLLAHFEVDGEFVVVQEYIEGKTLAEDFQAGRKFSETETGQFLYEMLETLAFVHKQNVIHRDIKPSNIIRRASDGRFFLIDFGAVKQVGINPFNQNATFKSTVAIGTNGYTPGEQIIGKPRFASDLYSLGLVTIQGVTGQNPLDLKTNSVTGEFMWQHKARLHPDVINFLAKLTRYDFRQRYNSAIEASSAWSIVAVKCGAVIRKNPQMPVTNPVANKPPAPYFPVNQTPFQPVQNQPPPQLAPQFVPPTIVQPPPIVQTPPQNAFQPSAATVAPPQLPQLPPSATTFAPPPIFNPPSQVTMSPTQSPPPTIFKPKTPDTFAGKLWNNDLAIGIIVTVGVIAAFIFGGYLLVQKISTVNQNAAAEKKIADDKATLESSPAPVSLPAEDNSLADADRDIAQVADREKAARTKADWQQIAKDYRAVKPRLISVSVTSPQYSESRQKLNDVEQRALNAERNAAIAIDKTDTPNGTNQTTISYSPTGSATPAPVVNISMPPKKNFKTYVSYMMKRGASVESKTITSDDALFTNSVEKMSDNRRDSGVVRINIDGGSYSSARLEMKAAYGQRLMSGSYPNAQEYLWQSPTMPAVAFDKLHCFERGVNSFSVSNIMYDQNYTAVLFLEGTFTVSCGDSKLMGRVRYDARY